MPTLQCFARLLQGSQPCGLRRLYFGRYPPPPRTGPQFVAAIRSESTGSHHSFTPGPITRFLRRSFLLLSTDRVRKRAAERVQLGLEKVAVMEREAQWLRKHKSPLKVLGLPEHADLATVKTKYKQLLFETHPDTALQLSEPRPDGAPAVPKSTASARTRSFLMALPPDKRRAALESDFALLQEAYAIVTNPDSLWYTNGSAVALRHELRPPSAIGQIATPQNLFALASYIIMFLAITFFTLVVSRQAWEQGLRAFDSDFYEFMMHQEADERRRREAGEVVDTEPARLAPQGVKSLLFPGRLIRESRESASQQEAAADATSRAHSVD